MNQYIKLEDISFKTPYSTILSHISFTLEKGKIVTLLGPNGAGKSTIAKIVLGLITPSEGNVIRKPGIRIGYVPQKINLDRTLPLTVERFLHLQRDIQKMDIIDTLERVNAVSLLKRSMHQLSGGEMQRILLAQSLLNKPDLLVLDEPAQGVDVNGQIILYDLIEAIKNELHCAILIISHDLHLVMAKTDEVICINKHICCSGSPDAVSNDPAFHAMFHSSEPNLAFYHHHHDHNHPIADEKEKND